MSAREVLCGGKANAEGMNLRTPTKKAPRHTSDNGAAPEGSPKIARARHVTSTNSAFVSVRVPPKRVTRDYLERLTDEVCQRYHRTMRVGVTSGDIDRYVKTRLLLEDEIERYRTQDQEAADG